MRKAVTVILERNKKFLTIKRQEHLSVFPGYTAFPGGKVDKEDLTNQHPELDRLNTIKHSSDLIMALYREVKEETGLDLIELHKNSLISKVSYFGNAVTPSFNPYRFDTYFYLVSLNDPHEKINFQFDDGEVFETFWWNAKEALQEYELNNILCVPPTISCFKAFDQFLNDEKEVDLNLDYDDQKEIAMIESLYGIKQFLPLSNTFPPANRTNSFLINDTLIDPSPKNEEELEKFKYSLKEFSIHAIFITHHHPDHHEYSVPLAKHLGCPIKISQDSHDRILTKYGKEYFNGVKIDIVKEADTLTTLADGRKVSLFAVPGHDEGQLAITDSENKWVIVGDLIQSVGTVVIGAPEGNMQKYFDSLEKVIALCPKFIIPSHGIALGGVYKLKMTLKHRKMREKTIIELLSKNKTIEEIYEHIYEGLDPRLKKYALKTIHAHIDKINS
tara:strand:+ start:268374 stop:269708 length:1335 start_codon:yes stop_codon:yes gene_type:complete